MAQTLKYLTRFKWNVPTIIYSRHLSSITKEFPKQTIPTNQDLIWQQLKTSGTTDNVLELVSSYHKIMNGKHLMQALRSLFTLQKTGNTELSTKQLLKHPDFERICNRLRNQIGTIELNETIEALKVVSFVGVSSDSTIVQVLLQLIRYNINDLTLPQIIFLSFLIKQFKSTPLIDALNIALPIVFEIQLSSKMDRDNISHLAEYLHFTTKCSVSDKSVETIVAATLRCKDQMDTKTAISIAWSICSLKRDQYFEPLLNKALDILSMNTETLSYNEMETTLTKLINNYSTSYPFFFNEVFTDSCVNYIIDNDLGAEIALYVARKFLKIMYVNNDLTDYISSKLYETSYLILNSDPIFAYITILYIASSDYRPKHWNNLKKHLEETEIFEKRGKKELLWLKAACSLIALDIYKPDILKKALNTELSPKHFRRNHALDMENLLLVTSAISVLRPEYKYLLPLDEDAKNCHVKLPEDYPLEIPLEKGLGNENYLRTGIKSELGFHIDHIVAMRPGGYPVAINKNNSEILEEINPSGDCQLILIFLLRPHHFTINCKRLKGYTSLLLKIFEAKGYKVLPISFEEWENLAEFEKIPYLMQLLKTKVDDNVMLNSVI